jgi:hypothetical protein
VAFYPTAGGPYPASYNGAVFFADYSRDCIWAALPTTPGGLPSSSNLVTFSSGSANPVDLEVGPGNELYYVDVAGSVRRIRYFPGNQPPTAVISATPTQGPAPLTVNFSAAGSTDPDPADQGKLTYAWDFTNNGTTDSTAVTTSFTRATVALHREATTTRQRSIAPRRLSRRQRGPDRADRHTVRRHLEGRRHHASGHATDPQQGALPASALTWHLRMRHCSDPETCHTHPMQDWTGVASGSFTAPDHEYPSYLELELVATDQDGLSHAVVRRLDQHPRKRQPALDQQRIPLPRGHPGIAGALRARQPDAGTRSDRLSGGAGTKRRGRAYSAGPRSRQRRAGRNRV